MIDLLTFIGKSPTAHHATSETARLLEEHGIGEAKPGKEPGALREPFFFRFSTGLLAAVRPGTRGVEESGCRIALAHTDSPGLQLKLRSISGDQALRAVSVEVYGSPILSTWLDRPLEVAGTLALRSEGGVELVPVRSVDPVGVIPNVAIHLNRKVNDGHAYDKHKQLRPLIDGRVAEKGLLEHLAEGADIDPKRIIDSELFFVPAEAPRSWGAGTEGYFTAGRIDNLAGVYANLRGFIECERNAATQIVLFFDHEEIGSLSRSGARSPWIVTLLQRLLQGEGSPDLEALSKRSLVLSNDATHANHLNYPEKLDPDYLPELGGGPAVKLSAVRRYASEPEAIALLRLLASESKVPLQEIQNRADIPAGTTVGPMSSAASLLPTVDLGIPILAMHSARESAHLGDVEWMQRLIRGLFESEIPSLSRRYR